MSDDKANRTSMAVPSNNTGSLRSRFEQLSVATQKGDTSQNKRRGATVTAREIRNNIPSNNTSSPTTTARTATLTNSANSTTSRATPTTSYVPNTAYGQRSGTLNSTYNKGPTTTTSPSTATTSYNNTNSYASTVKTTAAAYNTNTTAKQTTTTATTTSATPKYTATTTTATTPTINTPVSPSSPRQSDAEDIRTKPLAKPKPRQSQGITPEMLRQVAAQSLETNNTKETHLAAPVVNTYTPPPVVQQPAPVVAPPSGNLEISDKWRINYDDLEFDELVSAGSAGEVYLGYYYGTPVAIKKLFALAPDQKHLVAREYGMLQGLNHPNIVQFLGICDHSSGIYLITEYVEHGDLFDLLIFSPGSVSWKVKVKIAFQVASAMFYLHSKNIIHRDLKSQNILIGDNHKVKICDLGLATITENKKRMTVCGTNEWMAPEIALEESYDEKVDVFSFGIVITEMITEQPPQRRGFEDRLAFDAQSFQNSVPDNCPPDLVSLVIDCCKFNPQQRPTAKEVTVRLRSLLQALPDED